MRINKVLCEEVRHSPGLTLAQCQFCGKFDNCPYMKPKRKRRSPKPTSMRIVDRMHEKGKGSEVLWIRVKKSVKISTIERRYGGEVLASTTVRMFYAGRKVPKGTGSYIVTLRRKKKRRRKRG